MSRLGHRERALIADRFGIEKADVPERPDDTATGTFVVNADARGPIWTAKEFTADRNRRITDKAIYDALAELNVLINAPDVPAIPDGTMNNAQLSNALREMRERVLQNRNGIKRAASTLRDTIRLDRGDVD